MWYNQTRVNINIYINFNFQDFQNNLLLLWNRFQEIVFMYFLISTSTCLVKSE